MFRPKLDEKLIFRVFKPSFKQANALFFVIIILQFCWASLAVKASDSYKYSNFSVTGNYLAAKEAQMSGELSLAADFLKLVLSNSVNSPDLLRRTFLLLALEGRFDEALELGEKLAKYSPGLYLPKLLLAIKKIRIKKYQEAVKILKNFSGDNLSGMTSPLLLAWTLLGQGKVDEALDIVKSLEGTNSPGQLLNMHKGLILGVAGRHLEAISVLEKLSERKNAFNFRLVQLLGNFYELVGDKNKANLLYKRFRDENETRGFLDINYAQLTLGSRPKPLIKTVSDGVAETLFIMANSLRQQKAGETALVLGRLALYLKPNFPIMLILAAELVESDDRLIEANKIYNKIDPNSVLGKKIKLRIAANFHELNRTREAIKLLREMVDERPNDFEPLVKIGDYLRGDEKFSEAITEYDEAIKRVGKLKPRHWRLLYIRGIALERAKKWEKAEVDLLRALDLKPNQPYILNYLGYSYLEKNINLNKALEMIQKAVSLKPGDGYIIDSLGWGYYQIGKYDEAVRELERAVEYRPEDSVINDHLGDAYWQVGREVEAIFQWKRSLSLNPGEKLKLMVSKKLKNGLQEKK